MQSVGLEPAESGAMRFWSECSEAWVVTGRLSSMICPRRVWDSHVNGVLSNYNVVILLRLLSMSAKSPMHAI
jgi:hypothetical protein